MEVKEEEKMAQSVLQEKKCCWICGTTQNLHKHHAIHGKKSNRNLSEKYGLWLWLCGAHHNQSNDSVHLNHDRDMEVKTYAQKVFEAKIGTRDDFRAIFGKSYIL